MSMSIQSMLLCWVNWFADLIVLLILQEVERLRQQLELCKKNLSTKHEAVQILFQQVCESVTCG